jgi:PAT family acetyl-CoA transporter-like MFS transporter 1
MGLSASIPLILKEKGASYEALSLFSLVSVPFSLKLIWAPLVDSFYSLSFGRRKTWLVPVQFITGLVMIFGAGYVEQWLDVTVIGPDGHNHSSPAVAQLTGFFFFLYFLMATQDIAVDGWALTMLSRDSVGYASICNTIGQVLGVFIANQGFIALSDSRWCHKYLGVNTGGLVTLPDFMHFWGYVFIVVTAFIAVFKKEEATDPNDHPEGLFDTCRQIVAIFRLPAVQSIAVILLTCRMCVAPADAIFSFKLQEYGMPKSDIATISPLLMLTGLMVPTFTSSMVTSRPMEMFIAGLTVKMLLSGVLWVMVQNTTAAYANPDPDAGPGMAFLLPLVVAMLTIEVASNVVFISIIAFFSKISDPSIGGSYMTLLNTLTNLGSKWITSLSLYLLPKMTFYACEVSTTAGQEMLEGEPSKLPLPYACSAHDDTQCVQHGGSCVIELDGYTVQVAAALVVGVLWLALFKNRALQLQALPHTDWLISSSSVKGR